MDIEHYTKYKNVIFKEIINNEYIFVVSKKYIENNNLDIKEIQDLNNYSLILPRKDTSANKVLNKFLGDIQLNSHYEMTAEKMRKDFAKEGLGIAYVMKKLVEDEIKNGELIEVKIDENNSESKVGIAILKDEISSFATKKLVEYIVKLNS